MWYTVVVWVVDVLAPKYSVHFRAHTSLWFTEEFWAMTLLRRQLKSRERKNISELNLAVVKELTRQSSNDIK